MPKFSDKFIAGLKVEPGKKDRLVFDSAFPGLGLRVTAKSKTFLLQWTDSASKQKVRETLGVWGGITIDQAREAARIKLGQVAKGINPRAERLRQREEDERERAELAFSFGQLVDDWAALHLAKRRQRYREEAVRAIRFAFGDLMKRPATRVAKADAVNALDKLVKAGKTAMAGRTLAYARAAYQWAMKRDKVPANPFQGLPIAAGGAARERVLDDDEIAAAWAASDTLGYPWGPFFRLAMLTLQRRENVAGACWGEFDIEKRVWMIPGNRMKNGKPHDVHLSDAALDVLAGIPRMAGSDLVFSTTGKTPVSGFSKAKTQLDKAIAAARGAALAPWVIHDLRRSGVSTLARLGFDSIVVDKLLAHQPAKLAGVAAVYQRHDFARERAQALDAWAAHVIGQPINNVTPLHARA